MRFFSSDSGSDVSFIKVQRVFQIGALKKMLQEKATGDTKITAKVLKQHFDRNLTIKSGEAATEHFISTALALWNALFSVPRLKVTCHKFGELSPCELRVVNCDNKTCQSMTSL